MNICRKSVTFSTEVKLDFFRRHRVLDVVASVFVRHHSDRPFLHTPIELLACHEGPWSSSEEAQRIGDDKEQSPHVGGNRRPKARYAGEGQDHEHSLNTERERDVLADDTEGSPGMTDKPG